MQLQNKVKLKLKVTIELRASKPNPGQLTLGKLAFRWNNCNSFKALKNTLDILCFSDVNNSFVLEGIPCLFC